MIVNIGTCVGGRNKPSSTSSWQWLIRSVWVEFKGFIVAVEDNDPEADAIKLINSKHGVMLHFNDFTSSHQNWIKFEIIALKMTIVLLRELASLELVAVLWNYPGFSS